MVVCYTEKDFERVKNIYEEVDAVNSATPYTIAAVVVDASREKPSASKL